MISNVPAYFDTPEFEAAYHTDMALGCFPSESGTAFRLWAPTAQKVVLNCYRTGHREELPVRHAMTLGEKGVWHLETEENLTGWYYTYDVTVDGLTQHTADPYAVGCGLNGQRSMVVDLTKTNPMGWEDDRAPEAKPENIIYEVHVKDFSWSPDCGVPENLRGKFLGLCQSGTTVRGDGVHATGLDYLKHLGVSHVELMPIYDYGSVEEAGDPAQFNWGYDPVNFNVPEGSYATDPYDGMVRIRELKQAIQTLHKNGLRVIMDVVYNHTYHLDSWLQRTVPGYYYRWNADGTASNGSGCGNDTASERSMCAKYILDSVLYWAEEYHIDGFRFDLMGLLPVELMNRIRCALDEKYGKNEKLIFGEPWSAGATAARPGTILADKAHLTQLEPGVGAFCDATRDAVKGNLMHKDARGFVNGGEFSPWTLGCCMKGWAGPFDAFRVSAPRQTIQYLSAHDDWTLWDRLANTIDPSKNYSGMDADTLRANRLAAALAFGCQGNWFLLSGEEFGRTKFGVKNSYNAPLSINQLDWHRAWQNEALVNYYRGLFALRAQLSGLTRKDAGAGSVMGTPEEIAPGCACVQVENPGSRWESVRIVYNTGADAVRYSLPEGSWQLLADGNSSFLWQKEKILTKEACVEPMSVLVLGIIQAL